MEGHSDNNMPVPPFVGEGFVDCPNLLVLLHIQLLQLRADDGEVVGVEGVVAVEILVLVLGGVEFCEGDDFGDDGGFEFGLGAFEGGAGGGGLGVVVGQDDGPVLRAGIGALAVEGGGVVGVPEKIDDFLVGSSVFPPA
jgi:hypothetical protein